MKYWRKAANKVAVNIGEGKDVILTGRELKQYMKALEIHKRQPSNLLLGLIKRL